MDRRKHDIGIRMGVAKAVFKRFCTKPKKNVLNVKKYVFMIFDELFHVFWRGKTTFPKKMCDASTSPTHMKLIRNHIAFLWDGLWRTLCLIACLPVRCRLVFHILTACLGVCDYLETEWVARRHTILALPARNEILSVHILSDANATCRSYQCLLIGSMIVMQSALGWW